MAESHRPRRAVTQTRRRFLEAGIKGGLIGATRWPALLSLAVVFTESANATGIVGVRVWPASDYSRVTIESDTALKTTHFVVDDPDRLVVDIEGLQLDAALRDLVAKIQPNDPYIRQVRVGQNRPNVVRIVLDLKGRVNPQVFNLVPAGDYRYRLVFDLYPNRPDDPLLAFLEKPDGEILIKRDGPPEFIPDARADPGVKPLQKAGTSDGSNVNDGSPSVSANANAKSGRPDRADAFRQKPPAVARIITIALDPGHGGEDPGAVGQGGSHEKNVVLEIAKRLRAKLDAEPNVRCMPQQYGPPWIRV